jgi:dTDP-4-dehydrorhamnose reductase
MKPDAVLVIGSDGSIGQALTKHLTDAGKQVLATTRRPNPRWPASIFLDLTQDSSRWQPPERVSVAYFCAGVSSIDHCRRQPLESAQVNVQNTVGLAKALVARGTFVVFPSTNLVYDGSVPCRKVTEPVCPVTEYGRQKAEAERQLLALGDLVLVFRVSKVLAHGDPLFASWIDALRRGQKVEAFSDMVMAPLSQAFVISVLSKMAATRKPGIFQASGQTDITYEQAARYIAKRMGASQKLIQPVKAALTRKDFESIPAHTTLDSSELSDAFGETPPEPWKVLDSLIVS